MFKGVYKNSSIFSKQHLTYLFLLLALHLFVLQGVYEAVLILPKAYWILDSPG